MIRISNANLDQLPESIVRPGYNRMSLRPGIVHIGLGNFHRAHQAWYLQQLFQEGRDLDWAVIGAGVRPRDALQREKLLAQDCLSTLIELDTSGPSAEVIGAMLDYVPVQVDTTALIRQMSDPAIRIVSLTVTEGGYYCDPATKHLDLADDDVRHDIHNPLRPKTVFGAMLAALRQRRDQGIGPFTGLSCDNIDGNGSMLREVLVCLARESDTELARWIDENCTFPNSMVDCIVPVTGAKELALVREFGIVDDVPVTHENFRQWVVEDDFCAGRPNWDQVGVTFSDRVDDYVEMKLRVLNAGHQIVANVGELLSIDTISACMERPLVTALLSKVTREEILPQVKSVPSITPDAYFDLIRKRFANRAIVDTTRRVASEGSVKHPAFIFPMIEDRLNCGVSVDGLALVEALWARMCAGTREDGSEIEPNDPIWRKLVKAAKTARIRPRAWLEQRRIYDESFHTPAFEKSFETWLEQLWSEGCEVTLQRYTTGT